MDEDHGITRRVFVGTMVATGVAVPGQICSAITLLDEIRAGAVSAVTPDVTRLSLDAVDDDEIRERMSGNLCRCGAYAGIVAAVREAVARGAGA